MTVILAALCFLIIPFCLGDVPCNRKNQNIIEQKWPRGIVPYLFDPVAQFSKAEKLVVEQAMERLMSYSGCVTFTEISVGQGGDRVVVTSRGLGETQGQGCWAHAGRQGGEQALNLDEGCVILQEVEHQLFKVLGIRLIDS